MSAATHTSTPPSTQGAKRPAAKLSGTQLRAMIALGMRVGEIAKATGYARSTIKRHLDAHDIDSQSKPGPRPKLPGVEEIVRRIKAGEKASHIAQSCGAHSSSVHLLLYRHGLHLQSGEVLPKMEIVSLIASVRHLGLIQTLGYFRATSGEVDSMLAEHGFRIVEGGLEHNLEKSSLSLVDGIYHIDDVEKHADKLIAEWRAAA